MATHLPNGVSLEDCLTNTFILAETILLRWKRYEANPLIPVVPEQDPVLSTYSCLLDAGYLCAWQRTKEVIFKNIDDTPPKCEKELWVFWYDKEPKDLKDKIHVDLNANDNVFEDTNIKYEYKTVFYKALHNAIERHLLKQNYVRLDKWFLKPLDDIADIRSNKEHLSFCFSFFLHGDSNVCASVDITRHFPVRRITAEHISLASRNPNSINVMLAPHCLKATLTGVSYKSSEDSAIVQLLEEWNRYYPIKYASPDYEQTSADESSCTPSAVEVLVGDVVMCYPSWMVLISSPEDPLLKTSEVKATNMIPSLATNAGKICKRKGAILTSNQLDRNAHLMINASFKHSKLQPFLRSGQVKDPLAVSNLTSMSPRVESLNRTCLCCNTKDFRKVALIAASRKEKYSSLHSNSNFHQRSSLSQKKASNPPTSTQQENRLNSEVNSQHNATSVNDSSQKSAINIDPGSYPIMNELLGPSSALEEPLQAPQKPRFTPSALEPSTHFQVDTPPEEEPEDSHVDRKTAAVKLYYAGKYKSNSPISYHPAQRIETAQKPDFVSLKGAFNLLDKLYQLVDNPNTHSAFEANGVYFGIADTFNPYLFDQTTDALFGSQVSESVYDFDDRYDFDDSLSNFESAGLTCNFPSKRTRGNSRKGSVGRGKDQPNQQLKKPGKKRKTKNDGESSLETMTVNNINSSGNSIISTICGAKPKTPPGKTQLTSPSLTTAKSLELTKAEFVENTFESSDDEDHLPALPCLGTFNPENDHQPPSVKPPDSVELARMFPTPPSNNPLELGPAGGGGHAGINSPQTNSSSLLLPNGDKLLHSYEQSYGAAGGADLSHVLAAAGLATSTALVEQNQPAIAGSIGGYQTISNLTDDSPNMSLEVSDRLTIVQNNKIALHMQPNDYCCLDLSRLSPSISSALGRSPTMDCPKKKRWKPLLSSGTRGSGSDGCPSSSCSGNGTSNHLQQISRKSSSYNPSNSKSCNDSSNRRQRVLGTLSGGGLEEDGGGGADTNTPTKHGLVSTPGANNNEFLNTSFSQNPLSNQSHETLIQFGMTPLSVASSQSPATPYSTMHTPGGSNSAIGAPFSHGGAPTDITSPMSVQSSARTPFGAPGGYPSIGPLSHLTRGPTSVSSFGGTHSLLVNLYLSDSLLNLFTDINFDSCVICNCNMTIQSLDASLHLSGTPLALDQSKGILCECGFRALRNRHLAAGAGLFGEDEFEVVNRITYVKDRTILPWQNSQSLIASINSQLTSTCSLLPRFNLTTFLTLEDKFQRKAKPVKLQYSQRLLDGRISLKEAIQFARYTVDNPAPSSSIDVKKLRFDDWLLQRDHSIIHSRGGFSKSMALAVTSMGREIKQVCSHFASDSNKKCDGPLTWAQFYKASGDFTLLVQDVKPLPVPSLLVGSHERQNSSITPFAIHQWEKLFLEPFSGSRTVLYLTICPDDKFIIKATELFLKELSSVYQTCQLGPHVPAQLPKSEDLSVSSGICVVSNSDFLNPQNLVAGGLPSIISTLGFEPEWWNAIGDAAFAKEKLLLFSSFCQTKLPDLLKNVNVHLSLNCTSPGHHSGNSASLRTGENAISVKEEMGSAGGVQQDSNNIYLNNNIRLDYHNGFQDGTSPFKEPLGSANCISGIKSGAAGVDEIGQGQQTKLQQPGAPVDESPTNISNIRDNRSSNNSATDNHQPTIVVYVVDPFAYQSSSETSTACFASSLAFIKCFENVLEKLPAALRNNCVLQVLPLSAVETVTRWRSDVMNRKLLKSYCFSVYSKCSTNLLRFVPCKSLTTFGPSADKDCRYKKYGLQQVNFTPPYVLQSLKPMDGSSSKNSHELSFRDSLASNSLTVSGQDSKVLFVTYCLSHDHRWILVCCTDMIGEILLVNNINIEAISPPSSKKKTHTKTSEKRRPGLEKLWEFVLSIISKSAMPWRIVIGRFGRLGHGEIKDWHIMLSKPSLAKYSQSLKSLCTTCKLQGESCNASILSACLVSMESASHLQLFHDPQGTPTFGPETGSSSKKGSQSSLSSSSGFPLSHLGFSPTREVSATHVLVMPTSANTTTQVTNTPQFDGAGDFGFPDLFAWNDLDQEDIGQLISEISNDNNGSGVQTGNDATSSLSGDTKKEVTCSAYLSPNDGDPDVIGQLLQQQPLALGFYVSTAPTGHLPPWFWSSDPLSEFKSPSTLKAALHITTSMNDDRQKHSHPLDSHQTTTVLRHVLESYNALSWLNVDPSCNDRRSCLPVHMVVLVNMYHCFQKFSSLSPHEPFLSPTLGQQPDPSKT